MSTDKLIDMANRIGEFFEAMPDREEGLQGIAAHIQRSWERRMRRELAQHLDARAGAGLSPIVLEALLTHRALLA
jgi:formate dehydrogenase subunit delta